MQQQQRRPLSQDLHMPGDAAGLERAARRSVRPIGAIPLKRETGRGREELWDDHGPGAAARTASESIAAWAIGILR